VACFVNRWQGLLRSGGDLGLMAGSLCMGALATLTSPGTNRVATALCLLLLNESRLCCGCC
jgi:hypothetical protein